ncbi:MAG TPA: hypothetical protein VG711_08055 [Phycisphaerales bacterium]|nr:hypothetical protein [Phycisphaerales bacterium]
MTPHDPQNVGLPSLNPADAQALDALIDAGFDSSRIGSADLKSRAQRAEHLLALLKDYPVADVSPALLQSVFDRIDAEETQQVARFKFAAENDAELSTVARGRRFRWADLITVAAVILIGTGILMPVLSNVKNKSLETACANNMMNVARGLQSYANDNNGSLPMATAGLGGAWDAVSNLLNLKPLVDGNYCRQQDLECPAHHDHGPSISYQWQVAGKPITLNGEHPTVFIGDVNPLIDPARQGKFLAPLTVSVNHGGRGQNVLVSDLHTEWLPEPVVNTNDNIWLPAGADALTPGMIPTQGDVFLAN